MVEVIDNTAQLAVTMGCTVWAGVLAFRHKSQRYAVLACFYGTFALGLLYWLLYLVLRDYTPKFFYVSDLSWIASFLFLLLLNLSVAKKEEKSFCLPAIAVSAVLVPLTVILAIHGDVLVTL
ncbi:MAG: histidine kinase, partial [Angelakisella sp.]